MTTVIFKASDGKEFETMKEAVDYCNMHNLTMKQKYKEVYTMYEEEEVEEEVEEE